jgi:P-type conjugative transfer protein TrbJ
VLLPSVMLIAQFAVFDATNYAESVVHVAKAAEQIRLAESQIENQLRALRKLGRPEWRDIAGVVAAGEAGQSAAGQLGQRFASVFPGAVAARDFPADDRRRTRATLAALAGVLDAARASTATVGPSAAQIDRFKPQVAAAQGHEESLELANTVNVYTAQELTLLRQAVAAQTSAEAVYYALATNAAAEANESARALWSAMGAAPPRRPLISYASRH